MNTLKVTYTNNMMKKQVIWLLSVLRNINRQGNIHSATFSDESNKLLDCVSDTTTAEMRSAYKAGLKEGVALMREVQK